MTTNTSWLKKYVPEFPELEEHVGASGYFSQPAFILDPQLFEGNELKPHVREAILGNLLDYMSTRYHNVPEWTMAWLAGSGISYQWAADRGNGDLDVLFGIDYTGFVNNNPAFSGMDRYDISYIINDDLRTHLWPKTALTYFGRGETPYEVTFYLNYDTENFDESITRIQPYAAYNLTENHWTTEPENNPVRDVPKEYEEQAQSNRRNAEDLVSYYTHHRELLSSAVPNSPGWHNSMTSMKNVVSQARALFDQIHSNRRQAFDSHGEGYHDFYNYQWQAAKRDGIVQKLNQIANAGEEAQQMKDMDTYGSPIEMETRRLVNAAV